MNAPVYNRDAAASTTISIKVANTWSYACLFFCTVSDAESMLHAFNELEHKNCNINGPVSWSVRLELVKINRIIV